MKELQIIIQEIKKICGNEALDVTPEAILELSGKIYISNNISNQSKNTSKMPINVSESFENATDKQKYMLKQIGYTDDKIAKMSKQEAFLIIKKAKEAQ